MKERIRKIIAVILAVIITAGTVAGTPAISEATERVMDTTKGNAVYNSATSKYNVKSECKPAKTVTVDITKKKSVYLHPGEMVKLKAGSAKTAKWTNPKSSALQLSKTETGSKITTKTVSTKNIYIKSMTGKETSKKVKATVNGKTYTCTVYLQGYLELKGPGTDERCFVNEEAVCYIGNIGNKEKIKTEWYVIYQNSDEENVLTLKKSNKDVSIKSSQPGSTEVNAQIKTEAGYSYYLYSSSGVNIFKRFTEEEVQELMLQFPLEMGYSNGDPWGFDKGGCNGFTSKFRSYIFGTNHSTKLGYGYDKVRAGDVIYNKGVGGGGHHWIVYKKMTYGEWMDSLEEMGLQYGDTALGGDHTNCSCPYDRNEEGWVVAEGNRGRKMYFYNWYPRCTFDAKSTTIYSSYGD